MSHSSRSFTCEQQLQQQGHLQVPQVKARQGSCSCFSSTVAVHHLQQPEEQPQEQVAQLQQPESRSIFSRSVICSRLEEPQDRIFRSSKWSISSDSWRTAAGASAAGASPGGAAAAAQQQPRHQLEHHLQQPEEQLQQRQGAGASGASASSAASAALAATAGWCIT